MKIGKCFLFLFVFCFFSFAQLELTIYTPQQGNRGNSIAYIKDTRNIEINRVIDEILFENVARTINPVTLSVVDNTDKNFRILEQNYEFDIISKEKLLEKYLDNHIIVKTKDEDIKGVLLSSSNQGTILKQQDGSILFISANQIEKIEFEKLPENLITRPTLRWLVSSMKMGMHQITARYLATSMSWNADYIAVLSQDDQSIDLNGWVTITNNAGTDFLDAKIKLVSGNVRTLAETFGVTRSPSMEMMDYAMAGGDLKSVSSESFFEYHLYTLNRKTDLRNNQIKQIELLNNDDIVVEKKFVYGDDSYWWSHNNRENPKIIISFKNSKENGLEIALPPGIIRMYKQDSNHDLQYIGEDRITHTSVGDVVNLYIGDMTDVRISKGTQTIENTRCLRVVEHTVTINNFKNNDEIIKIIQPVSMYQNTMITYETLNSRKVTDDGNPKYVWNVNSKANTDTTLTYRVKTLFC